MKESTHTKKIHDVLISSVDLVFNNLELLLEDFAAILFEQFLNEGLGSGFLTLLVRVSSRQA